VAMRLFSIFAGLLLAGCSLGEVESISPSALDSSTLPNFDAMGTKTAALFKSLKLAGSPEVSHPRKAPVTVLADWMICLKGDSDPLVYAVFFAKNDIATYRVAVLIDKCAGENFEPLRVAAN
jgi:hypothetical protein